MQVIRKAFIRWARLYIQIFPEYHFWRNMFAHNNERNPRVNVNGTVDVVNNVIYNSGWFPTLVTLILER